MILDQMVFTNLYKVKSSFDRCLSQRSPCAPLAVYLPVLPLFGVFQRCIRILVQCRLIVLAGTECAFIRCKCSMELSELEFD